jgi:hypothetical protein
MNTSAPHTYNDKCRRCENRPCIYASRQAEEELKESKVWGSMMNDKLNSTVNMLLYGLSTEEIRASLLKEGMSEYQAWLTFKGAQFLYHRIISDRDSS